MACDGVAFLKGVEVVMCIVCMAYKRLTDMEALQTFYYLEKHSREWQFANNVTWNRNGSILADITFGAYIIICFGLLIAHLAGELRNGRKTEMFFLVLGAILFLVVGGLVLASIDDVPHTLVDNAIVLGVLAIVTALLLLLDAGLSRRGTKQADTRVVRVAADGPGVEQSGKKSAVKVNGAVANGGVMTKLKSSFRKKRTAEEDGGRPAAVEKTVDFKNEEKADQKKEQKELDAVSVTSEGSRKSRSGQPGRRSMENRGFVPRAEREDSPDRRFVKEDVALVRSAAEASERKNYDGRESKSSERFADERHEGSVRGYNSRETKLDERRKDDYGIVERPRSKERRRDHDLSRRRDEDSWYDEFEHRGDSWSYGRGRRRSLGEDSLGRRELMELRDQQLRRELQSPRVSSSRQNGAGGSSDESDAYVQQQMPSASYLLAERAMKVLPTVQASPVERAKPQYYYHARTPGYVLQAASNWPDVPPSPVLPPPPPPQSSVLQGWLRDKHTRLNTPK